jgi:hypothetical protein
MQKLLALGLLAIGLFAQPPQPNLTAYQPDAQRTKQELSQVLGKYPPTLREVLALDPSLLSNQPYLAPYPVLVNFLATHPEIARNPEYYLGRAGDRNWDYRQQRGDLSVEVLHFIGVLIGFGMAIGLLAWLIRTFIDYRRWNRLANVQTEVHTRLLDRFTGNEELLAYIQSPAGSKFLQSAPISLDAGPRSLGAPLGRILWSVQAGLVLAVGGLGLLVAAQFIGAGATQPLNVLGILATALGIAFIASAAVSFVISKRLGLVDKSQVDKA